MSIVRSMVRPTVPLLRTWNVLFVESHPVAVISHKKLASCYGDQYQAMGCCLADAQEGRMESRCRQARRSKFGGNAEANLVQA